MQTSTAVDNDKDNTSPPSGMSTVNSRACIYSFSMATGIRVQVGGYEHCRR
jgi:hypothetical protein